MVPTSKVDDAALAKTFKALSVREPVEEVQLTELSLPSLKPVRVVLATGWGRGGHSQAQPLLFALDASGTRVLEPVVENLDDDGYKQRVSGLLACTVEGRLQAAKAPEDLEAWQRIHAQTCRPFALRGPPDALAALLCAALDGHVPEAKISTPALVALLAGKQPPHTKWTLPERKLEPWTVEAKRAHGMVQDDNRLLWLSLELKDAQVVFERHALAFEQRFIE